MPPKKKDDKAVEDATVTEEIGVFYHADGTKYDGQYTRRGDGTVKRHGCGVLFDNGSVYDGQWHEDKMHGKGTIQMESGAVYSGQFLEGRFYGRGTYTWPDGSMYIGQWKDNLMHGEGIMQTADGKRFAGRFYDGQATNLRQEC